MPNQKLTTHDKFLQLVKPLYSFPQKKIVFKSTRLTHLGFIQQDAGNASKTGGGYYNFKKSFFAFLQDYTLYACHDLFMYCNSDYFYNFYIFRIFIPHFPVNLFSVIPSVPFFMWFSILDAFELFLSSGIRNLSFEFVSSIGFFYGWRIVRQLLQMDSTILRCFKCILIYNHHGCKELTAVPFLSANINALDLVSFDKQTKFWIVIHTILQLYIFS